MTITYKARVWEKLAVTGTGTITLASVAASGGYQTFATAFPSGATVAYCISDATAGTWEVGVGTFTFSGTTLTRAALESSNANALVSFAGNPCDVQVVIPSPITLGAGASSSGLVPALNASGLLDKTILPAVPYDFAGGIPGKPTAAQVVAKFVVGRAMTFPANFAGSAWAAGTAPAAAATFTVNSNGTAIGTIVFAASATTATFTTTSGAAQSLAAGAVLTIVAPATADSALSDASGTLVGVLQ